MFPAKISDFYPGRRVCEATPTCNYHYSARLSRCIFTNRLPLCWYPRCCDQRKQPDSVYFRLLGGPWLNLSWHGHSSDRLCHRVEDPRFCYLFPATGCSTASTALPLPASRIPHRGSPTGLNDLGIQGWPGTCPRQATRSANAERTFLLGPWLPVALLSASKCRPRRGLSGFSHSPPLAASNIPGGILDLGDCAVEISSTHAP